MLSLLVARIAPFLALGAASITSCVWTNGRIEIVPPQTEGTILSMPPLPEDAAEIAWAARIAPTPEQSAELESLRTAARARRLSSTAVRGAEQRACKGLSNDDRDVTPFFYRDDIVDVESLRASGGARPGRLEGAIVTFRDVEGLTARRLQAMLDCQIAREEASHYAAAETRWCPLSVQGTTARVERTERGLEVRIEAGDPDAIGETYARAMALVAAR